MMEFFGPYDWDENKYESLEEAAALLHFDIIQKELTCWSGETMIQVKDQWYCLTHVFGKGIQSQPGWLLRCIWLLRNMPDHYIGYLSKDEHGIELDKSLKLIFYPVLIGVGKPEHVRDDGIGEYLQYDTVGVIIVPSLE